MKNNPIILRSLLASVAVSAFTLTSAVTLADDGDKKPKPEVEKTKSDKSVSKVPKKDADDKKDKKKKDKKKKDKTIAEVIKDQKKIDGLFTLYQDPKSGKLRMVINEDQLDKEFIYSSHITDGVVQGGHFRGQYRADKVLRFKKYFNRIELIEENPNFYFDPDSALAKAKDANISKAVLAVFKIEAKSKDKKSHLINVDKLFKGSALDPVKPTPNPRQKPWEQFRLGKMDSSKTKIAQIKNFPENMAIKVDYVFTNPAPLNHGRGFDITDARNVTVKMQHSLVAMPQNDFKPRYDDARVGYFLQYVNNMTDHSATPWRDMINRWHFEKKDPNAAVSEVVKPLTWWIENTTPKKYRETIKNAALSWNIAFEAAGLKNAIDVKIQPDDADWDADDLRYNVLRWTSSPMPPFGGYGPSSVNPRTGQILGADIMLEMTFITNRMNWGKTFDKAGLQTGAENADAYVKNMREHQKHCNLANTLKLNTMLGRTLAATQGNSSEESEKMIKEGIEYLILHEIGHTLGLNHNMKATSARSYETVHDISAQKDGLVGSVMDYPAINFAPANKEQAHYYTNKPAPYDIWAIQYGYSTEMEDAAKRDAHLARSSEKWLAFGNDADDMRSPGKGMDPRVNIYDMTDDAVAYARDRLKMDRKALGELKDRFVNDGDSYQALRNAYLVLTGDIAWQGRVTSRFIGGVYIDRSLAGQKGATAPYRPVEVAKQKEAMQSLRENIFSPAAFEAEAKLISHLAIQRRGFMHYGPGEDPKIHARAFQIQKEIVSQILHPATLSRITDSSLYGNTYSAAEVIADLTDAIFEDDIRTNVNGFRQNLQINYVESLIAILSSKAHDYVARSGALGSLQEIQQNVSRARSRGISTRAHRDHIQLLINKALEFNK